MMLEKKVVEEAGAWQKIIAPIFDEIMQGNPARMGQAEIILDILKRTKSEECYREYQHLYNNILLVTSLTRELNERYPDAHQDGGTG